jgi:hypothetical protein
MIVMRINLVSIVNNVKGVSEVVDLELGNMSEVLETSMVLPSIQLYVELNPCFRVCHYKTLNIKRTMR